METTTELPEGPDRPGPTRRGLLARVTGLSAGLFAGMAALTADEAAAYPYACCGLATDIVCRGCSSGCVRCPPKSTARYWYCCDNGQLHGCVECTPATTCWDGPFLCSCGFRAAGSCSA